MLFGSYGYEKKITSAVETFFEQKGLIIFMCQLKLPTAREQFENLYKKHRQASDDDVEIVVTTCRELCTLLCKKPLKDKIDQEAEEIGGPLKAHGFLRCMTRMDILMEVKAGTQGSLQLGVTKKHYKLTATTDTTKRKVQQWLDLHDTVHCILAFEAPDTLEKWNVLSDLLKDALKRT